MHSDFVELSNALEQLWADIVFEFAASRDRVLIFVWGLAVGKEGL